MAGRGVAAAAGRRRRPGPDDLDALRRPLTGYCYRILGGAADADDAVQESLIRAAAALDRFDPSRAKLTTWVHRIATNVCIDMLRSSSRRALAVDLGPPVDRPDLGAAHPVEHFVEPMPDGRVLTAGGAADPADLVMARETVRLAFIAALQHLPPLQRVALVLRDVLAFSAQESAQILDSTVASVNSALQRARAGLEAHRPDPADLLDPSDRKQQDLLARYVAAFETHDMASLTSLLREDATSSMPPFAWWLAGRDRIVAVMAASDACAGDRLVTTTINGTPGFGQYRPDPDGRLLPFALVLVELRDGLIAHLVTFLGIQHRFTEFGLPAVLDLPISGDR
jgi:RNA polymerase sigma-70 factor (ECF subfamily)